MTPEQLQTEAQELYPLWLETISNGLRSLKMIDLNKKERAAYLAGRKKTLEENERLIGLLKVFVYKRWENFGLTHQQHKWQQFKKDNGL